MKDLVLIAHNLRSSHNIGSLIRTAEGLGVGKMIMSGYSPYPLSETLPDTRLPHLAKKVDNQISKTALGAEKTLNWQHLEDVNQAIKELRAQGYAIAGLEQTPSSTPLPDFQPSQKLAIIVGREVEGLEPEIIEICDHILEIPMFGQKESFNVVQAAAMALYHCRFA